MVHDSIVVVEVVVEVVVVFCTYIAGGETPDEVASVEAAQIARVDRLELLAELLHLQESTEDKDIRQSNVTLRGGNAFKYRLKYPN